MFSWIHHYRWQLSGYSKSRCLIVLFVENNLQRDTILDNTGEFIVGKGRSLVRCVDEESGCCWCWCWCWCWRWCWCWQHLLITQSASRVSTRGFSSSETASLFACQVTWVIVSDQWFVLIFYREIIWHYHDRPSPLYASFSAWNFSVHEMSSSFPGPDALWALMVWWQLKNPY